MKKHTNGFTIIELMFATTTFSVVLLLCLTGVIQIGRMYYKGLTTSQTQQTARSLLDELTQSIQLSGSNITATRNLSGGTAPIGPSIAAVTSPTTGTTGFFCIGTTRYTYALDRQQDNTNDGLKKKILHAMWADEPGVCASVTNLTQYFTDFPVDLTQPTPSSYNGRDVLADNMRLTRLAIQQLSDDSVWQVTLTVAYGDEDLLITDPNNSTRRICQSTSLGGQFCAISELSTIVTRRLSVQ
ncbi:hypothetical protein EB118_16100 [bacterium]|nr:hypothetical protein [bacterium]NBX97467.1 hypothetical protein [bacterium]NDC95372.1 hypothetical protein [bacterium]NDD83846.1 hypothetical protein [bacterium]NDG31577.1 hypothetical protein [bacterium]